MEPELQRAVQAAFASPQIDAQSTHSHGAQLLTETSCRASITAILSATATDSQALDNRQLLDCYLRLLEADTASRPGAIADSALLPRIRSLKADEPRADLLNVLGALHRRIDDEEVFRCRNCTRFIGAGFEFNAPRSEWSQRSSRWIPLWEPLRLLWETLLEAARTTMIDEATAASPRHQLAAHLLGALVRLLPCLCETALTSEQDNQRWRWYCGTSQLEHKQAAATTWLEKLAQMRELAETAHRLEGAVPHILIILHLQQVHMLIAGPAKAWRRCMCLTKRKAPSISRAHSPGVPCCAARPRLAQRARHEPGGVPLSKHWTGHTWCLGPVCDAII